LIFAPLLRNLIQDDPRTRPEVEAFDHPEHRNADAHLASFDGAIADADRLTAEPDRELRMDRIVALMKVNAGLTLHMWGCDDRLEVPLFQTIEALVRTVETSDERPFHGGNGRFRNRSPVTQILPIVRQRPARIDDIDLLDPQSVHVAYDRADVLHITRALQHGDQILAAKLLNLVCTLANGPFRLHTFFHGHPRHFSSDQRLRPMTDANSCSRSGRLRFPSTNMLSEPELSADV